MEKDYTAPAENRVEALIAMGLYRVRVNAIKNRIKKLFKPYKNHLKPLHDVREMLAKEIPEERRLSQEIVKLRKAETH